MEVASAFLGAIGQKLYDFLQENRDLQQNLEHDVDFLKIEVEMIAAAIRDDELRGGTGTQVDAAWVGQVREFAHGIEDCIDRFRRCCLADKASRVQRLRTLWSRWGFASEIRELRKKSGEISSLKHSYSSGCSTRMATCVPVGSDSEAYTASADLVGMGVPRDELLGLIRENQGEAKQLKVVSVCGFGGLGKTRLAREVYMNEAIVRVYEPRLWIPAADKGAADVLKAILEDLEEHGVSSGRAPKKPRIPESYDVGKLSTRIRDCLDSKRFFIVIDDMRTEFWNIIKTAFPTGESSRVVVTTAIQHIAAACSSSDGYVYAMRPLDKQHSRQLFLKEASLEDPAPNVRLGSEALKKCDGLPLALVTTAQFLQSRCDPTFAEWAKLCGNLGEHLETEDTLARMKNVLLHSYTSLPDDQLLKAFLLYLGSFPCGHPVRTDRLIRRWLAEEFIVGGDGGRGPLDAVTGNFKKLVDRCIIQPIDISNNKEVKTWQIHGMMLEFILHKSTRENFITFLRDQACSPSKIRWLSLYHNTGNPAVDLSLVRSMTIFGKAHESVLEFSKYELLRLLDLEECDNQLEEKHLREICKLLLLRYLSLCGSITTLPKDIAKLQLLETLDVRRTEIKILPIQVIELPCLIHLFGKFKLADVGRRMSKLQKFLSEKSKLETLEGFVADEGFAHLMDHMNNLTKVEIWCESNMDATILGHLSKSIKGFIQRGTNESEDRSLSLNFDECSKDLLNFSLENPCYLSKLILQGNILSLPPFVTELAGVTELCLLSSSQLTVDILTDLIKVSSLLYLKLNAIQLDKFEIAPGVLDSLLRLCIEMELMGELDIKEGALPCLESLQLLCKDPHGFSCTRIQCFRRLKEVMLHDGASEGTKKDWKEAAQKHPRRPRVLFAKIIEVDHMEGSEPSQAVPATDHTEGSMPMEISGSHEVPSIDQIEGSRPVEISESHEIQAIDQIEECRPMEISGSHEVTAADQMEGSMPMGISGAMRHQLLNHV